MWQWQTKDKQWHCYDDENQRKIQHAETSGMKQVQIDIGPHAINVKFAKGHQKNLQTRTKRKVRKVPAHDHNEGCRPRAWRPPRQFDSGDPRSIGGLQYAYPPVPPQPAPSAPPAANPLTAGAPPSAGAPAPVPAPPPRPAISSPSSSSGGSREKGRHVRLAVPDEDPTEPDSDEEQPMRYCAATMGRG